HPDAGLLQSDLSTHADLAARRPHIPADRPDSLQLVPAGADADTGRVRLEHSEHEIAGRGYQGRAVRRFRPSEGHAQLDEDDPLRVSERAATADHRAGAFARHDLQWRAAHRDAVFVSGGWAADAYRCRRRRLQSAL